MPATTAPFQGEIVRQVELAISEADLVLLLVDATTSPGAADLELADRLRRSRVPVLLVANKLDNPAPPRRGARVPRARPGRSVRALGAARHRHGRSARRDRRAPARARRRARRAHDRRDRRRHPRPPERRQVVAPERALRRGAHDRLRDPGHDARLDRHPPRARRPRLSPDRHGGPAPSPRAAPAGGVLERGALARGRAPRRYRARPDRLHRGHHGAGPARGRRGAPGQLGDHLRALEVGHRAARARGRARAAAHQGAPAPADRRHLGAHQARPRAPRARHRRRLRPLREPRRHGRVQPPAARHPGDARGAADPQAAGSRSTTARRCRRGRRASG